MEEETIKKFVRDVCFIIPIPKSEVRRRLNDLFKTQREDLYEQIIAPILMWTERNSEWELNRDIRKSLAELEKSKH